VDSLAFVDEGRVSCDHEEPAQLRKRSDDILGNAVGKILLLRIATHVREGKHGDCRPIGSRGQRLADLIRRQRVGIGPFDVGRAGLTDKAQTLTRYGADQLLLVAAITDRFPRGIDTTCKSRVRHDPTGPNCTDEIVLADDPIAVLDQVNQEVEYLRLNRNRLGPPA
jgi:hypothetical protein